MKLVDVTPVFKIQDRIVKKIISQQALYQTC